jgi:hypothetical protein
VDAVCVSEDKSGNNHGKSKGRGVEGTVGAVEGYVGASCEVTKHATGIAEEPEEDRAYGGTL